MMGTCQKDIVGGLKGVPLIKSRTLDDIFEQTKNFNSKLTDGMGKLFFTV